MREVEKVGNEPKVWVTQYGLKMKVGWGGYQ